MKRKNERNFNGAKQVCRRSYPRVDKKVMVHYQLPDPRSMALAAANETRETVPPHCPVVQQIFPSSLCYSPVQMFQTSTQTSENTQWYSSMLGGCPELVSDFSQKLDHPCCEVAGYQATFPVSQIEDAPTATTQPPGGDDKSPKTSQMTGGTNSPWLLSSVQEPMVASNVHDASTISAPRSHGT